MIGFWICVGMKLWKSSEYSSIPSMPGFCVCKCCTRQSSEYAWIWWNNVTFRVLNFLGQCFKWAYGSKYAWAQNMVRLWICECYTVCWIWLNTPEYALIMSQYAWICLNNPEKIEYWICQNFGYVWCSTKYKVIVQITEQLSRQRCI